MSLELNTYPNNVLTADNLALDMMGSTVWNGLYVKPKIINTLNKLIVGSCEGIICGRHFTINEEIFECIVPQSGEEERKLCLCIDVLNQNKPIYIEEYHIDTELDNLNENKGSIILCTYKIDGTTISDIKVSEPILKMNEAMRIIFEILGHAVYLNTFNQETRNKYEKLQESIGLGNNPSLIGTKKLDESHIVYKERVVSQKNGVDNWYFDGLKGISTHSRVAHIDLLETNGQTFLTQVRYEQDGIRVWLNNYGNSYNVKIGVTCMYFKNFN
ncbi:hypothetical protein B7939_00465 [Eggerthia catenaformis]|nr:hypothetical protein B7939_00465 [Eggerthia catenaformis]